MNIEYWDPRRKVLQKWRIFYVKKNILQESRYPERVETVTRKMSEIPIRDYLGGMGDSTVPELVRKQTVGILVSA